MQITFKVDLEDLTKFKNVTDRDLRGSGTGPIRVALKQWALRYRTFLRKRYLAFSRGGGNWPPLKPATIRRRRKKSTGILIDTGSMITAFEPVFAGKPGQLEETIPFGIRVGVGGSGNHPEANMPMARLFEIHNAGEGHVPERKIVVPPDAQTVDGMVSDMERAIGRMLNV